MKTTNPAIALACDQAGEVCELTPPSNTEASGWMPIETAPKEGKTMYVVKAFNVEHGFPNGRPYTSDPYCVWPEGDDWARWPHGFAPTHWMPLPAAPNALSQTSKEKQ